MKPNPSKCTVVAVGSWNPAIFTPEWVSSQLGLQTGLTAEVAFAAGAIAYRFSTNTVVLEQHPGRLQVAPAATGFEFAAGSTEAALSAVQQAAVKIAQALPVTPLTAFGVNFAWQVGRSTLRSDFVHVPEQADLEAAGHSLQAVSVSRILTDARSVRTTLTISGTRDGRVQVETNQHREVKKCEDLVKQLELQDDYRRAKELVERAYVKTGTQ